MHASLAAYERAKARVWRHHTRSDVAIAPAGDPVIDRHVPQQARVCRFGLSRGDYHLDGHQLVGPDGTVLVERGELLRSADHDVVNALAASAIAVAGGATPEAVGRVLRRFSGLAHRMTLIARSDGVCWYDDSKATVPHATLAALGSVESAVLIAGGRNKGIDLTPLAEAVPTLRGVVAIGEAAAEVAAVFAGTGVAVTHASSMSSAVEAAARLAQPGDAVVLSPACASFDWFDSYGERGRAFADAVREVVGS